MTFYVDALLYVTCVIIAQRLCIAFERVPDFTRDDFEQVIEHGHRAHFIMFYKLDFDDKMVLKTFHRLAEVFNKREPEPVVTIAKMNCEQELDMCKDFKRGEKFPIMKFYDADRRRGVQYKGEFSLNDMKTFIQNMLHFEYEEDGGDAVLALTDRNMRNHRQGYLFVKFYAPWCGYCKRLEPVWEKLAHEQHESPVVIAKADCTKEQKLCAEYPVEGYPTILFLKDGAMESNYRGKRTLEAFQQFLEPFAKEQNAQSKKKKSKKRVMKKKNAVPVHVLNAKNFKRMTAHGLWFIKFYSPHSGYCEKLQSDWTELGKNYIGDSDIKFGKIDCSAEEKACHDANVWGLPGLWLFKDGVAYKEFLKERHLNHLHDFVKEHVPRDEL